jgi:hypothetical protein
MQSIGLVCDDAAEGVFNDTVTCTADPSSTNTGPFTYALQCDIGPADLGTFGSTPMSGGTIDLTPGGPVPEGTDLTNAGQLLVRNTGQPGDTDVDYSCDITGGSTEITQSPSPSVGTLVAGGGDIVINYSCDTTADGAFSATVQCDWDATGDEGAGAGSEMYTVTCDVRDPETDVTESPPNGTPQIADVMPGDPVTFSFTFTETLDEGEPASLDNCSLSGGAPFAITAPASFPQPIPSGGSVQVDVEFTDPGMGDTFNDLLTCVYTDTDSNPETVNWPLEVNISGRNARFRVTKDFDDDNAAGVEVTMDCNTGLPLQQSGVVYDPDSNPGPGQITELQFIIVDFEPGTMNCDISEVVPAGYEGSYFADVGDSGTAANVFDDEDGCHYEGVEGSDFICEITNELQIVTVTVFKEWIDEHPEFQLPTFAEITLWCNEPIFFPLVEIEQSTGTEGANGLYSATTYIQPGSPGVFGVYPHWDGSTFCFVTETPEAGVIQDVSDCENIPLAPGQGGECTIVNTRLFAGIPTLSQYGLILLALLMLDVGLVGFRRYT